jgi:DNA repair protein RadA/Sms
MMKVISQVNQFRKVNEVEIPEIFYRRFKTGVQDLDFALGGEGFLPGQTFTLAGEPGSGKTTLLLQTLELIEQQGLKTAYVSGEESVYQVAFAAKRLNLNNISIANLTVIEDIFDAVKEGEYKMIVLDSLPSLETRSGLEGKRKEEYLTNYITSKAKELEVVVGVILHITKQGKYKGSTLLPHSVDANIMLRVSEGDETVREIEVTKNRFGRTGTTAFPMTEVGFSFQVAETSEEAPKKSKSQVVVDAVLTFVKKTGSINQIDAAKVVGDVSKVQKTMKDLVNAGLLIKNGRSTSTVWTTVA